MARKRKTTGADRVGCGVGCGASPGVGTPQISRDTAPGAFCRQLTVFALYLKRAFASDRFSANRFGMPTWTLAEAEGSGMPALGVAITAPPRLSWRVVSIRTA
eukprot:363643-Chlamydomonas_euryale.AAC.8